MLSGRTNYCWSSCWAFATSGTIPPRRLGRLSTVKTLAMVREGRNPLLRGHRIARTSINIGRPRNTPLSLLVGPMNRTSRKIMRKTAGRARRAVRVLRFPPRRRWRRARPSTDLGIQRPSVGPAGLKPGRAGRLSWATGLAGRGGTRPGPGGPGPTGPSTKILPSPTFLTKEEHSAG